MADPLRVAELWRYPVKSLQGERVESATLGPEGLEGDRRFAIFDVETGFGLTARRQPDLLFASAALRADGGVDITLPDGRLARGDEDLSAWLGRRVELREADADVPRRYENPADADNDADWRPFEGATGAFHDSGRVRVSLVSRATIGAWPQRRFRSNVLLEGEGEDTLVGGRAQLGGALLDVTKRISRCVMVTRAQPGDIERDPTVLRAIARERDACLAIGALVVRGGEVGVGAELVPV